MSARVDTHDAIELQPQQTVYAKGWAEGSPQYGSNFYIELYDENQIYLTSLVNAISVYGFTEFPGTFWPAMFTHTAANPATYYLRLWTRWYPTHAFQFTIEVPKLKLFLDADEPRNFNPNAPEDDISTYLPGTTELTAVAGGNKVLVFGSADAGDTQEKDRQWTPPLVNAAQKTFGGGRADGYVVLVDGGK